MTVALLALGLAAAATPAVPPPRDHAARDVYVRFERAGYRGNVYLGADGRYLIVQTGLDGATKGYGGRWTPHGATGVCIAPDEPTPGKCLPRLPDRFGVTEEIRSDRDELYRLSVERGR